MILAARRRRAAAKRVATESVGAQCIDIVGARDKSTGRSDNSAAAATIAAGQERIARIGQ
jgi:hypothetical protein